MYTFKKEERLCSKKLLEQLFHNGSSFLLYPFRISWLPALLTQNTPVQVVINVSKHKFKRATDRNLLKRRIREAYRLNKENFLYSHLRENNTQLLLSINYIGKEMAEFILIDKKLKAAFEKLKSDHDKRSVE